MPRLTRLMAGIAIFGLVASAHAFDPGTDRVCTPSADGQRFECHDKSDAAAVQSAAPPAAARPARTAPVTPAPTIAEPSSSAPSAEAPFAAPAPAAGDVPNYLLQSSRASQPINRAKPAVAVEASPRAASDNAAPSAAQQSPLDPAAIAAPSTAVAPERIEREEAIATKQKPAAQRETPATPATPTATPVPVVQAQSTPTTRAPAVPATTASPERATRLAGVADFIGLTASHYTVVLASVRNAKALDALILALDTLPGKLYLLKLGMPDGNWYSLCWSEFNDLDAARAARALLPAEAAITSGWPRKIGLLQKEIAR